MDNKKQTNINLESNLQQPFQRQNIAKKSKNIQQQKLIQENSSKVQDIENLEQEDDEQIIQGNQKKKTDNNWKQNEDQDNIFFPIFEFSRKLIPLFKIYILIGICALSFLIRIFSVIQFESVIHEYDPWFNFRSTRYLLQNGVYSFWNWFDSESWHPLGRVVGGTVYPGIMFTACFIKWTVEALGFPNIDIREICVFMAPIFSIFQCISTYKLAKQTTNRIDVGLLSALFIAIVPTIISRGVAGSYDNEAVSIWAMVHTFYLWIKAINTGSTYYSIACTLTYFYMVASWGGYVFIINIIPLFVLGCIFINKLNSKIFIAYNIFYTFGTLMAMLITFVNFQVIRSSEHLLSHITFLSMNFFVLICYVRENLPQNIMKAVVRAATVFLIIGLILLFVALTTGGRTQFSGRSMSLIDPSYATEHQPLIASVAEHAPSTWTNYFVTIHHILLFVPLGLYLILTHKKQLTHGNLFIALYTICSAYFSCAMVRLHLILAPAVCVVAAIASGWLIRQSTKSIRLAIIGKQEIYERSTSNGILADKQEITIKLKRNQLLPVDISIMIITVTLLILRDYIYHSNQYSAENLSSPSIILSHGHKFDGSLYIYDDFREAYYWLKQNTDKKSKILSWWDYGYQITGMSNRTVIVDNNTWNNTHIATVGKFLQSNEEDGYEIAQQLDADYVLMFFGGYSNNGGDDFSKFLWFVRIGASAFSDIEEEEFYKDGQHFGVSEEQLSDKLRDSLTYKFLYYRFGEIQLFTDADPGYDPARQSVIGHKDIEFTHFEEAYTSKNWMIRIYRVLPRQNRKESFEADSRIKRLQGEEGLNFVMEEPIYEDTEIEFKGDEMFGVGFDPEL